MSTITLERTASPTGRRLQDEAATGIATHFKEAKALWDEILEVEKEMCGKTDEVLLLSFRLGSHLIDMKEEIGHGRWLFWLGGTWPQLGERNAQRCMTLVRENPEVAKKIAQKGFKSAESADFTKESRRKFLWHYVPPKERLELPGDQEVTFQPHYLTFVNQYSKWRRQVKIGHAELPPIDTMRRDFEPTVRDLIELLGRDWIRELL